VTNLTSRILVGVVGLPLVLGVVWLGGWWLFALLTVAGVVGVHEFVTMARPLRPLAPAAYAGVVLALLGGRMGGAVWMLGGFLTTFVLAFALDAFARTRAPSTAAIGSTVLGAAWIGLGLAHMIFVREIPEHGALAAFTVLLTVFVSDTAAYGAGRLFGRHKMAPRTSPGKTWEGFVAGTIAALLVPFFALYEEGFLTVPESLVLGGAIALAAPMGDLFESALKRDAGIKDSGRVLLGHGGVLDRIDALLFAVVASYYLLVAFGVA
jgi:phosphatidate cytidylyltransferase